MKNRLAVAGSVGVLFAVSLLAIWVAPYDPNVIDLKRALAPPSAGHLFGTDQPARDVLSRMIWGAGSSLKVGFVATGIRRPHRDDPRRAGGVLRSMGGRGHHA